MSEETEVLWSPGDVAKRLGVSPSGLRRLAGVYAEVYGELPKDSSGTSRRWPSEAVARLEQARALLAAGQARSIKDALLAVEGGATASADAALALLGQEGRVVEALGVVAARLEALQNSNRELRAEVEALRREVVELRALPASQRPGKAKASNGAAGSRDGLMVRAVRWVERYVRGNSWVMGLRQVISG